jgi:mono/diheme cytochrome c family protein
MPRVLDDRLRPPRWLRAATLGGCVLLAAAAPHPRGRSAGDPRTGAEIFRSACAACHGADGRGAPREMVGVDVPLPDFTDCRFTAREQDADWAAIIRDGGPVRGFSRIMPAFRDALAPEEIRRVIAYLRTLCRTSRWPRGELNLPLPLVTEKAFPEDEALLTTAIATRAPHAVSNALVYERRIGARSQLEVVAPFSFVERERGGPWTGGIGDLSIGAKQVLVHSLRTGTLVSGAAELALPTGDTAKGLGMGTSVAEAALLVAQLLPAQGFLHLQGGVELPTHPTRAPQEGFWRAALGTTIPFGPISRTWSPMVELLGARELTAGAPVEWDVVPQAQLTLSARQHVRANLGVDLPLTQTDARHPRIVAYVLWDWFDGGLLEGWRGWCAGCRH